MGCQHSSLIGNSDFVIRICCPTSLEAYDSFGRKTLFTIQLDDIERGVPPRQLKGISWSKLYLARLELQRLLERENLDTFAEGLRNYSKRVRLEEICCCRCCIDNETLEILVSLLNNSGVRLKRLSAHVKQDYQLSAYELPLFPQISELLNSQTNLEVLDLSGSTMLVPIYESYYPDLELLAKAVRDHHSLNRLVLSYARLSDDLAVVLFRTLGTSVASEAEPKKLICENGFNSNKETIVPKLRHLKVSRPLYGASMGVSSSLELFENLPSLQYLRTLVFEDMTFASVRDNNSLTYMIHHIEFLDVLYARYNVLQDRLPKYLLPMLGYVQETIDGVKVCPYISKRIQARNQLLLAGIPVVATGKGQSGTTMVQSSLLPDWKQCWGRQTFMASEWRRLKFFCQESRPDGEAPNPSRSFKAGNPSLFRTTAIFWLVQQSLLRPPYGPKEDARPSTTESNHRIWTSWALGRNLSNRMAKPRIRSAKTLLESEMK